MFGGLTKTSSRIAIAASLGMVLGGYALSHTPAQAGDYGGDCCADLEERVAELEATTVRKGNKKVSVTLSGWVVKTMNWWDNGGRGDFWVGDKDADLASRFAITGSATIAPGWSAGYNITVTAPGDTLTGSSGFENGNVFGIFSNDFGQNSGLLGGLNALYSYMYIKSDTWGTLNWGQLSPASDNPAVLADISGTVIESNAVFFEGAGFLLRPTGGRGAGFTGGGTSAVNSLGQGLGINTGASNLISGPASLRWGSFTTCASGIGPIGADCFGGPQNAVRYDSPTWGGFRFETSYGNYVATNVDFWDVAAFYNQDWGNFKVSAAYAFTLMDDLDYDGHQVGATIMHTPSGLGLYGLYVHESAGGIPDTDSWYLKPFIKQTWTPLGATVLYGEYGQYNDMFGAGGSFGADLCATGDAAGALTNANAPVCAVATGGLFITGSEVDRWGLGVVQEIDAAAMHVFARWQHQDVDVDFIDGTGVRRAQGFEDFDLFQIGGILFF